MKRYISILLVISMLLSFAACGEKEKKYTVTFETNGGNTIPAVTVLEGQPVSEPSQPTKDGMFFAGWYRDAELSKVYDFSAPVTADLTLYAKWTKYEGSVSADSAPVDTYLISHLTVEGDTVSAAVSAPAGCKLLVRFIDEEIYFSDSYPENKAYLANGDVQAACAVASGTDMETVSAKLSGALPQYYVAEAVLTDDSGAELCSPFSAIDHTARYAAFNSTTIHDFAPEDTVLQFTDSETDNFGVLSGDVITLNAESFVFDEGRGIYEVTGASQTVKAGDKVLLSDGENFALIAVAAVSKGSTLTITAAEDDVSLEDFYQFLKVDQDIVSSAQEDEDVSLSSGPEVLRGQIRKAKKDVSANKIIKLKLDKIDIDFLSYSVDGKVSGDISVKLLLQRDEKRFGKNYFRCEFSYTADMDAKLTVEDKPNAENAWEETELSLGKVAIPFGMMGLNAFAEIRARVAVRTEGGMELQGGFKTTQGFRYSSKDTYQVIDQKRSYWTMSCEGYGEVEFGPMPVVGVEFLGGVLSCELDSFIGVRAEGVVTEPEHTGDTIHACNRCAEGTLYSVCFTDAVMEYDISKSLSGRPIDENIVYSHEYLCDFFVSLNNEANSMFGGKITFGTGLCPNWITNTVATEPAPTEQPTELPTELPTTPPTAPPATEPSENYSEGLEFTLNRNQTGYVVTGIGSCSDTEIIIPPENQGLPVTSISAYAFRNCYRLTRITIPNGVTIIGLYAFEDCTSLTGITIPDSVTSIHVAAFYGCTSLTDITIPSSVTSIGGGAFIGCSSLTGVTIPSSVTSIGDSAFRSCTSLTGITIPSSVTSIGDSAFLGCTSLTGVTIPSSVTSIGDSAFYNCSSLTGITIPNSVTSIGDYAFEYCTSLTGITIPNSVTSIGGEAFNGCTSLTSITIPNSVTSISSRVFESCTSLTGITIPSSVTSIGYSAFEGCTSLTGITIPNSVTSIGDRAFEGCTSLTGVTIPNSVTSIGRFVFYNCRSLTDITYTGSVAQWQAVSKISYWNSSTGAYVIYCTDGQIAKDGTVTYK